MFGNFFSAENPFFRPFGVLVDVVCLSVLWLVCSLPLVTLGGATAALYDVAARCVRGGRGGPYARFFGTFRANWKAGAPLGLLLAGAVAGMAWLYRVVYAHGSVGERGGWYALYYTWWVAAVVLAGLLAYLLPTLSRFDLKPGALLGNCLRLGFGHLPSTLALGVVTLGGILLCGMYWWPTLFLPCLWALLCSFPLERIFKPFMEEKKPPAST